MSFLTIDDLTEGFFGSEEDEEQEVFRTTKPLEEGIYLLSFQEALTQPLEDQYKGGSCCVQAVFKPHARYVDELDESLPPEQQTYCRKPNNFYPIRFNMYLFSWPKDQDGKRIEGEGFIINDVAVSAYNQILSVLAETNNKAELRRRFKPSVIPQPALNDNGEEISHQVRKKKNGEEVFVNKKAFVNNYEITKEFGYTLNDFKPELNTPRDELKYFKVYIAKDERPYVDENGEAKVAEEYNIQMIHPQKKWFGFFDLVKPFDYQQLMQYFEVVDARKEGRTSSSVEEGLSPDLTDINFSQENNTSLPPPDMPDISFDVDKFDKINDE